jgi:hypothetical protein
MTNTEYTAMIEAARQEGRAEGELLGVAKERVAVCASLRAAAERDREQARKLGGGDSAMGRFLFSRADDQDIFAAQFEDGDHHPEHSDALTRLIAEKQAEALEELADDCGDDHCVGSQEIRERAAAYRKGGAP